jgi:hypothetical protein
MRGQFRQKVDYKLYDVGMSVLVHVRTGQYLMQQFQHQQKKCFLILLNVILGQNLQFSEFGELSCDLAVQNSRFHLRVRQLADPQEQRKQHVYLLDFVSQAIRLRAVQFVDQLFLF